MVTEPPNIYLVILGYIAIRMYEVVPFFLSSASSAELFPSASLLPQCGPICATLADQPSLGSLASNLVDYPTVRQQIDASKISTDIEGRVPLLTGRGIYFLGR
jgi:hypothetical protein